MVSWRLSTLLMNVLSLGSLGFTLADLLLKASHVVTNDRSEYVSSLRCAWCLLRFLYKPISFLACNHGTQISSSPFKDIKRARCVSTAACRTSQGRRPLAVTRREFRVQIGRKFEEQEWIVDQVFRAVRFGDLNFFQRNDFVRWNGA